MGVSSSTSPRRTTQVTEETRELILEAADAEFAACGFASARLADIAERVGITRAAIIYHFRDKKTLYDAVLEAAFGPLSEQIQAAVTAAGASAERIERVIGVWFDCAIERPTLGRLFIREVASAEDAMQPKIERLTAPMFTAFLNTIEEGQKSGEFRPINAVHVANILSGAAIWLTSGARPAGERKSESSAEDFATYRDELAGVAHHLLGIRPQEAEGESLRA